MEGMENFDIEKLMRRLRQWFAFIGPQRVLAGCGTAIVLGGLVWFVLKPTPVPIDAYVPRVTTVSVVASTTSPSVITVHVAGAVKNPGVYRLSSSARANFAVLILPHNAARICLFLLAEIEIPIPLPQINIANSSKNNCCE